ncbi:MAG TPA: hypothetical protein VFM31_03935 [Nitrososphaeraceae archaeon]|nr:hypothetical protein [Nitrososphaeraceae archaeon]
MNITNSLIILAAIMLSSFLVFSTATTTPTMNVFASQYEEQRLYDYYYTTGQEVYHPPGGNKYDSQQLPDYTPKESYGDGYYDHYESGFYEELGTFGIPYDIQ